MVRDWLRPGVCMSEGTVWVGLVKLPEFQVVPTASTELSKQEEGSETFWFMTDTSSQAHAKGLSSVL